MCHRNPTYQYTNQENPLLFPACSLQEKISQLTTFNKNARAMQYFLHLSEWFAHKSKSATLKTINLTFKFFL